MRIFLIRMAVFLAFATTSYGQTTQPAPSPIPGVSPAAWKVFMDYQADSDDPCDGMEIFKKILIIEMNRSLHKDDFDELSRCANNPKKNAMLNPAGGTKWEMSIYALWLLHRYQTEDTAKAQAEQVVSTK